MSSGATSVRRIGEPRAYNNHETGQLGSLGGAALLAGGWRQAASAQEDAGFAPPENLAARGEVPRRKFGKSDVIVSAIGLGGHTFATAKSEGEAIRIVQEAVDNGMTFLDNAWEYHDGKSEELMGKALAEGQRRDKAFLMTKVCSHGRDKKVAMQQLEQSLKRLRTDHLDLWQIHEVVYYDDPARHFAPGGAIEALAEAKQQGKTRFIGFTGHKDPEIHLDMLQRDFPFDACQLPLSGTAGAPLDGCGFFSLRALFTGLVFSEDRTFSVASCQR